MTHVAGATVLVTGGAQGLGRLLGYAVARLGGQPVLWDLDGETLAATAEFITDATGVPVPTWTCDVTDLEQVGRSADAVRERCGTVDIVVNNAGVVSGVPLLEADPAAIRRTLEVNTLSLFWVTRAFLGEMVARDRGHIVTIASAAGWIGVPRQTDYAASKFGAVGFDEALRMELSQRGSSVRTTLVCPYYIDTGMFAGVSSRWSWLLPILRPRPVVTRIIDAVQRDKPRLFLPPVVGVLPLLRGLPPRWFDRTAELLGVTEGMQTFRGRTRPTDTIGGAGDRSADSASVDQP